MPKIHLPAVMGAIALLLSAATGTAMADIVTRNVDYTLPNGATARGVAVFDDAAEGRRPGVLVIPEWWGLNDYPKMRARQLAEMGYVAFVADMYGEGRVTRDAGEAAKLSGAAQQAGLAKLAEPALAELRKLEQVDGSKIAAIGFCFGGSTVADMVRNGMEIKAGVSFHGTLGPELAPAAGSGVSTPLMVLHGGADPMVAPEAVAGFVQKCIEAGVPISFVNFPAAVHAFSNPDADQAGIEGVSYDEQAAKAGWRIMGQFLAMTIGAEARDPNSLHGLQYDGADQPEEAPD